MEDLIIAILQGIFEFLMEVFGYSPVAWFIIGCGLACVSMLFLNRTWISHPVLRILNLISAPFISAIISQAIARRRNQNNPDIIPRNHFWQAFWFTLGIVTVRFTYAVRY